MNVTYSADAKTAYFDGIKFRKDAKTGYFLASKKTHNGKRERLHCYVWRYYNGEIPSGCHIHHVDENKNHNDIENLACIAGTAHEAIHAKEYAKHNRDTMVKNLREKAIPKAAEWHKSEEGRAWHSEHAKKSAEAMEPNAKLRRGENRGLTMKQENALFAGTNLPVTNTPKQDVVPEVALTFCGIAKIEKAGTCPVYNMEVDEYHNFAVNGGIIVHNCMDATRYFVETVGIWRKKTDDYVPLYMRGR